MAFYGGIAYRDLRWGFTCEHCGREAEVRTTLKEKCGEKHKASSAVYGRPGARMAFEAGARAQLQSRCAKIDRQWLEGKFTAPPEAEGICPHCHKYQSWSKRVQEAQKGKKTPLNLLGSIVIDLIGSLIGGIIGGLIISLIIYLVWKSAPKALSDPTLPGEIIFGLLAVYLVGSEVLSYLRTAASLKALSKTEARNEPRFIAWEGEIRTHGSGNIRERV